MMPGKGDTLRVGEKGFATIPSHFYLKYRQALRYDILRVFIVWSVLRVSEVNNKILPRGVIQVKANEREFCFWCLDCL